MASRRTSQPWLRKKVTLRAEPNIKVVAKDLLESQPSVEKEEEHRKEINKNYKRESWAQLATIDGNVKSLLLPKSGST